MWISLHLPLRPICPSALLCPAVCLGKPTFMTCIVLFLLPPGLLSKGARKRSEGVRIVGGVFTHPAHFLPGLSWIEAAVLYQMSQLLLGSTSPMVNGGEREQYNKKMYKVSNYYLKYFPWVNKWGIMVYNTLWRLFSIWAMKPSLWK